MAYRRPLSPTQSIIIAALWVFFVFVYLYYQPINWGNILLLLGSALFVFYPIIKSLRERQK